ARPLGVGQAAAFQLINPKVWVFALGAMSTFRPMELPIALGTGVVALTMMGVVTPPAALWAAGGGAFARVLRGGRWSKPVSGALAVLVAAAVGPVWCWR